MSIVVQDKLFMKVLKLRGIDLTQVNVPCHVEYELFFFFNNL